MGIAALHPSCEANGAIHRRRPLAVHSRSFFLLLLAFAQALRDRGAPSDQRGFIRKALREIGVILLHDVEYGFPGKLSMVLGKELVQVGELFVVHCPSRLICDPKIYRNPLILGQLSTRLVTIRGRTGLVIAARGAPNRRLGSAR